MFSPVLREKGDSRMVYSTSLGFRIVFLVALLIILLSIASVPEGSFLSRLNPVSLTLIGICLFAVLYLERWIFDKKANLFEKNVGILLLYWRKRRPLDALRKVVFHEAGPKPVDGARLLIRTPRRIAVLSVVDRDDRKYRLDTARGGSVREMRRSAERLSAFCSIPLEEDADDAPSEARQ